MPVETGLLLVSRCTKHDSLRDIHRTLFGGRAGSAFFACGNDCNNCRRKVSNSEYLGPSNQRESGDEDCCM